MSLLDEARAVQVDLRGPNCTVASLPPALLAEVNEALDEPRIFASTVSTLLASRGHDIKGPILSRHRKRGEPNGCRCPR